MFHLNLRQLVQKPLNSQLFDEISFYPQFLKDLANCQREVIIESPFITPSRMEKLYPIFKRLLDKKVRIHVITRDPKEHDDFSCYQATEEILECSELGINVHILRGRHHRKLAIIDGTILWEGSLNILSYSFSKEIMRRFVDKRIVKEMLRFLNMPKVLI